MLTRREFVGAALGGLAIATNAFGLREDNFRWAMSSHMFTPLKPHPETGITMAARFGFDGIEPWANEIKHYLSQPPEVFKKVLDESRMSISSISPSGPEYFDSTKLQTTLDGHAAIAKFASYFGVTALKANIGRRPAPIRVIRERNYSGWISLDFNYVDMNLGVTIEQEMAAHRRYLIETLQPNLKPASLSD